MVFELLLLVTTPIFSIILVVCTIICILSLKKKRWGSFIQSLVAVLFCIVLLFYGEKIAEIAKYL